MPAEKAENRNQINKIDIIGVGVADVDYQIVENFIADAVREQRKIAITYASANIINLFVLAR